MNANTISPLRHKPGRPDLRKRLATVILLAMVLIAVLPAVSFSQSAAALDAPRMEAGIDYNYVRTNAPPGGCGCISMNGGDGWFAYNLTRSFAAVAQFSVQHASNIGGVADLTFTSYLFGPRYSRRVTSRIVPFGQLLLGGAHAGGSLAPGTSGIAGSPNAFAMTAGGGVDIDVRRNLAIRPAEVDYFLTRFDNAVNDHQNNFRFAAGVVFRF
jgi:peptidoglycan-associated lipoprotein